MNTAAPVDCSQRHELDERFVVVPNGTARRPAETLAEGAYSADAPLEACTILASREVLLTLRCADGTRPLTNKQEIVDARVGASMGAGRCNGIIDAYDVSCPEAAYAVYIDPYVCEAHEANARIKDWHEFMREWMEQQAN